MRAPLFLLLLLSVAPAARAEQIRYGSACGLVDYSGDPAIRGIPETTQDLGEANLELSQTQEEQVILGTKALFASIKDQKDYQNVREALLDLATFTSDGMYLEKIAVNGQRYDQLMTYPGDNPYAVIFREGTLEVVALVQDSDVVCQ